MVDPDASISGQVAGAVLAGFAEEVNAVQLTVATAISAAGGFPEFRLRRRPWSSGHAPMADPVTIADVAAATPGFQCHVLRGRDVDLLRLPFRAVRHHRACTGERRGGTMARLLASPLRWQAVNRKLAKCRWSWRWSPCPSSSWARRSSSARAGATRSPWRGLVAGAALAATGTLLLAVPRSRGTEEQASSIVAVVAMVLAILGGTILSRWPRSRSNWLD